jgi:hypothetical protein
MADMVDKLFRIHARKCGLEAGESLERLELPATAAKPRAREPEPKAPKAAKAPKAPDAGSGQLDLFSA